MPKEETKERKSSVDGKSAEGKEKKVGKGKFTKTAAAANNVRCRSFDPLRCKISHFLQISNVVMMSKRKARNQLKVTISKYVFYP